MSDETRFVLPRYGDRALSDLLPSVAAAMGFAGWANVLDLPQRHRYVVVMVDGLGWHLLRRHADLAPYLAPLLPDREPLTCGIPSTTATSLTSLGTGLPPGQHGVVGYTSRIPGTNELLNALKWDSGVDPHVWQSQPTVFERLAVVGARVGAANKGAFRGSGLTVCSQRGADYYAADDPWERIDVVSELAEAHDSLTYAYESTLDHIGHEAGSRSDKWLDRLTLVDGDLRRLRESLPSDAVMIVTGDHGMVDVDDLGRIDVSDHTDLLEGVVLLGGEARLRHLYCRAGAVRDVAARWESVLGERAVVRLQEDAEADGWFGPIRPDLRARIGDVVVASAGRHAVLSRTHFPIETKLVGFHGSLTAAEMLVPLLVDAG
ncbi:MAG TPA: nucleotide pyrophosphatase/phosphodiesterase family protein [Nocardioidaceae bacterium]|nr:nucleotide pyrophosphatase/phosphodiesterase family protein [Nocardioidaceae bacterium]